MAGPAHSPARLRVASPALAGALRAGHPAIDVVCRPTPEIDALLAAMREDILEDAETEQSYLSAGAGPDAVAALLRAAASLFRAKPWQTVPSDQSVFSVTIEKLGLREAALSVIGQMGESLGLVLFSGIDDFEAYLAAAEDTEPDEEPALPPHLALNFERGADLSPALRSEIATNGWEVAGPDAYPWLVAIDEALVARPPTAAEVRTAEAIALALPSVLAEREALLSAWNGGEPVVRAVTVTTHAGELEVVLRAPHGDGHSRAASGVPADPFDLAQGDDEGDDDARRDLHEEILRKFEASPEGEALPEVHYCDLLMDYAAEYFDETIVTLGPADLRRIVFEVIPRKVSLEASEARWIIEELRAFYAFLGRALELGQAERCLRVLGGDAVQKLEAALSDPGNFGLAKSIVMAGREAGFDMSSPEGIEAWMRVLQSQPLPPSVRLPPLGGAPRTGGAAAARSKKNRRKASRKARRKNR